MSKRSDTKKLKKLRKPERDWLLFSNMRGNWSVWEDIRFERHLRKLNHQVKHWDKEHSVLDPLWIH